MEGKLIKYIWGKQSRCDSENSPVTEFWMAIEKVPLVIREIRLFLLAVGALAAHDRGLVTLARLHHLLVAGRSSMEDSLPGRGEIHRAERAEVGCRVALDRPPASLRRPGRVAGELVALEGDQRSHYSGAQLAPQPLLVLVASRQTLLVARLPRVDAELQVVAEAAVATGARQAPLTADHDRHRAVHHRAHVSVARVQQMRLHSLVSLAPKVARGAPVAAAYLEKDHSLSLC